MQFQIRPVYEGNNFCTEQNFRKKVRKSKKKLLKNYYKTNVFCNSKFVSYMRETTFYTYPNSHKNAESQKKNWLKTIIKPLFFINRIASRIWGKQLLTITGRRRIVVAENKKRISIEVDAEFHRQLKLFATLRGMSLQAYITTLIKNDMKNMK